MKSRFAKGLELSNKQNNAKEAIQPDLNVSNEFIEENRISDVIKKYARKGGPYSKHDKEKRRNEIWRLHFDYGYPARKIAELMKVNRNTVNSDIDYWYSRITKNYNIFNPEVEITIILHRLENQRTRLREELDKATTIQEKLAIERFIYDVDSKILNTHQRMAGSERRIWELSTYRLNEWLEKNNHTTRFLTLFDKISVSKKAKERITKIIAEDRKQYKPD